MSESQQIELARHFVQRTRRDLEHDWEGTPCFPEHTSSHETYLLSRSYLDLFRKTYDFCSDIVKNGPITEQAAAACPIPVTVHPYHS